MPQYLVSLSIGPVQDFISASRRTRDLWFGSKLLSEISKAVARYVRMHGELIFPHSATLGKDLEAGSGFAVVNKLLAVVEAADYKELRGVVAAAQSQARDSLMTHAEKAFGIASDLAFEEMGIRPLWSDQLGHAASLEFYAAWAPYDEADYAATLAKVEQLAAARKTVRDFPAYPGIAGIPKSSLDGVRESVIEKNGLKRIQFFVNEAEQLDALGVVKRFGGRNPRRFESTTDVAAIPYEKRLRNKRPADFAKYQDAVGKLKGAPYSSYLYPHYSRSGADSDPKLVEMVRRFNFPPPRPPYYAFFIGDGDSMGKAIDNAADSGKQGHQGLSGKLSEFAASAAEIFKQEDRGELIFAGGDDVMALLPLDTALETAWEIRSAFKAAMGDVTFSAGMAVVHSLDPLTEARRLADKAEKHAKAIDGKDALAITVSPRSGADVTLRGKWDDLQDPLHQAVRHYRDRTISQGYAHELRTMLDNTDRRDMKHLDEALFPMARALAIKKEAKPTFLEWLAGFQAAGKPREKLNQLASLLLVARPFARAKREAES